jgi:hypothetical protein
MQFFSVPEVDKTCCYTIFLTQRIAEINIYSRVRFCLLSLPVIIFSMEQLYVFLWSAQNTRHTSTDTPSLTLQRHNNENLKQIFPEKELCGLIFNVLIHVSFGDFQDWSAYCAAGKYLDRFWEYINRSQTHKCGNWIGTEVAQFLSGNTKMGF